MTQKTTTHKKKKKSSGKTAAILIVLIAFAALSAFVAFKALFIQVDGKLLRRDSETLDLAEPSSSDNAPLSVDALLRLDNPAELDLRGRDISVADYERLHQAFPACRIRWDIPIGGQRYDSESSDIVLSDLAEEELPLFSCFSGLRSIDASAVDNWTALLALSETLAEGQELSWNVPLDGRRVDTDTENLTVGGGVSGQELLEKLACFKDLRSLRVEGGTLSAEEQLALTARYPDVEFLWDVELCGVSISPDETEVDLSGRTGLSLQEILDKAPLLPQLTALNMTGCGFSNEQMAQVKAAYPNADVQWSFNLYGVEISTADTEIDFSGIPISDPAEIENVLPFMPHLEKVIMSDCGISDEDMDALNKRHEDVRFVWTVYFGRMINDKIYSLRTDTDHFIAALAFGYEANREDLNDETIQPLKYCTDMVALDIGHQHVTNLEFVRDMKKLRYLVVAENEITDISPLAELPELYFVELFINPFHDISPLLECKSLRHLNICHCDIYDYEDLAKMTWLERLWFMSIYMTPDEYYYLVEPDILPDTEKVLALMGTATGGTWRYDPSYYEMRDILGAYYMPGGTEVEH